MAYVIVGALCERAGECAPVCPTDSIHFVDASDAVWSKYYINPNTCIDCGACAAACPHEAIFPEDEVPGTYAGDTAKNAEFYTKGPGKNL